MKEISDRTHVASRAELETTYYAELAKIEYENAKAAFATDSVNAKRAEFERQAGKKWEGMSDEERRKIEGELAPFKGQLFLGLHDAENKALRAAKIESFLPEKRERFKAAFKKGLAWWGKRHWTTRALIGAGVSSTAFFGAGAAGLAVGAGAVGAPLFFTTRRVVGSLIGGGTSLGVGKLVDRLRLGKRKEIEEKKSAALHGLGERFTPMEFKKVEDELVKILEEEYRGLKRETIIKIAAVLGTSLVAGGLTGYVGGRAAHAAEAAVHGPELGSGPAPQPNAALAEAPSAKAGVDDLLPTEETLRQKAEHFSELTTARKDEGAWQSVYRQLEARLNDHPEKFNLSPEDAHDAAKVKHALDARTLEILKHEGYINPDGTTKLGVRIDSRVILTPDDHVKVEGAGTYDFKEVHGRGGAAPVQEMPAERRLDEYLGSESADTESFPVETSGAESGMISAPGSSHAAGAIGAIENATASGRVSGKSIIEDLLMHRIPEADVLGENGRAFLEHYAARHPDLAQITDPEAIARRMKDVWEYAFQADALTEIETKTLDQMEYLDEGYLRVIRGMPVKEFLAKFPWGPSGEVDQHAIVGRRLTFELTGDSASPEISEQYAILANSIKALAQTENAKNASVGEFLTTVGR